MSIRSHMAGPAGRADRIQLPDVPESAETVCSWLIEAPGHTPAWDKYYLAVVRLRDDIPGFPAPIRQFEGTTHELLLMALSPDHPVTPELLARPDYALAWLEPVNLCEQFIATDDEMVELADLACWSIVNGDNAPEPPLGYASFREDWRMTLAKTLGRIRGEVHAP